MTTLILVRHGESEANKVKVFAGNYDIPLSQHGHKQAQTTAKYLKENYKIDKVYASDLQRAYATGKYISEIFDIPIVKEKKLREISAGEWEGKSFTHLEETYKEDYKEWRNDTGNARPTGGESVKELSERINSVLLKIAEENENKTVAIATHATPIRAMQSLVEFQGLDEMKNIRWVTNASVSVLEYENGKWKFKEICQDTHLEGIKTFVPPNV